MPLTPTLKADRNEFDDPSSATGGAHIDFDGLAALLKTEERELALAAAAIEHANVGLSIYASDGTYIHANEEAQRRTGYTPEEYAGKYIWDVAPEITEERFKALWDSRHQLSEHRFEVGVRTKDGHMVPTDVSIRVMEFDGEEFIVALSLDITERKNSEEALRESERRFAHAFQGSPVSTAIIGPDGIFLEVNRAWEADTGFAQAEVVGRTIDEIGILDQASVSDLTDELFTRPELMSGLEWEFRRKDGEVRLGYVSVEPIEIDGRTCILAAIEDITDRKRAEAESAEALRQLENLTNQTITTMARLVEARDPYTAGHEERVSQLSVAIADLLGVDKKTRDGIRTAAQLHDIGKMNIPAEILAKPGQLSSAEFSLVKGHAEAGFRILSDIDFPWPVAEIVHEHHERLDGSGYPRGLTREQMMPEALVIAVADVVEAMSAHRPYRPALGIECALAEIERGRGTLFDEAVVDACVRLFRDEGFQFV